MNPHLPRPPADDDTLAALLTRAALDEAPPAAALAAVLRLRPVRAAATAPGPAAAVRRLVAQWVGGESGAASRFGPALGVRGAAGGTVQRLYRAEQCEIDVRIRPQGEAWAFAGQLFGLDAAQQVQISGPGFEAAAEPGATQEFGFNGLPAGSYTLTVKTGDLDIVIPAIDVGSPGAA